MAKVTFLPAEWQKILDLARTKGGQFGLPESRAKSLVVGTFNIREFGAVKNRTAGAWDFLQLIGGRFDLLAIQEVAADLGGIRELKRRLGPDFGMVVSDVTGVYPGASGNAERLAFLFNWKRVERTELASDITHDRSWVAQTLFDRRQAFGKALEEHAKRLAAWEKKAAKAKAEGKKKPSRPPIELPCFLTFIRQPHCASFRLPAGGGKNAYEFLAVNAHLLFGENPQERRWEFDALVEWLTLRAKDREKLYHRNLLMMGDMNLEFEDAGIERKDIDARLKKLNATSLKGSKAAKVNFPLLTPHPARGELRTNARLDQTYDQIAIFAHDKRLPDYAQNAKAGQAGPDGYDYGVFNFMELIAAALHGKPQGALKASERDRILARTQWDVSDHMPAWFRLPIPGA